MAIHYLQSNMEGEDIALDEIRDDPTYDDDSDLQTAETGFGGGTTAETLFGGETITPTDPLTLSLEKEKIRKVVDTAYEKWNNNSGGPPEGAIQYNEFRISPVGGLMLKDFPDLWLMNKDTGEPRALSTIAGKAGGLAAIRDVMGYEDYGRTSQKFRRNMAALQKSNDNTLECLINVPVRVFISRKMPPYTGLIWHYTFIKKKKKKIFFFFFTF